MNNKICIITGCNSGIGKITAIELAKIGHEIIMLVRDSEKSRIACEEIKKESKSDLVKLFFVDLSSINSIKHVATLIKKEYSKIDVLINNAGVFKRRYDESENGFEMTIAVNYLAVFTLTNMLLPLIKKANNSRIINLSSELYKRGKVNLDNKFADQKFNGSKAYANSKLLVIYFTKELADRLKNTNITVNSVHPGVIGTDVFREYPKWFNKFMNLLISKPSEGAKPPIYLAISEEVKDVSGKYFVKIEQQETDEVANNKDLSKRIWNLTDELIRSNS